MELEGNIEFKEQKEHGWRMVNDGKTGCDSEREAGAGPRSGVWILFSVQWEPTQKVRSFYAKNDTVESTVLKEFADCCGE